MENESLSTEELIENQNEDAIKVPTHQETTSIIEKGTQTPATTCNQSFPLRKRLCIKKKNGPRRDDVTISDVLSIMKTIITEKKKTALEKDECYAYGEYIGKKLKSYDTPIRAILINEINNLIFKMDMNTQPSSNTFQIEESRQQPSLIT